MKKIPTLVPNLTLKCLDGSQSPTASCFLVYSNDNISFSNLNIALLNMKSIQLALQHLPVPQICSEVTLKNMSAPDSTPSPKNGNKHVHVHIPVATESEAELIVHNYRDQHNYDDQDNDRDNNHSNSRKKNKPLEPFLAEKSASSVSNDMAISLVRLLSMLYLADPEWVSISLQVNHIINTNNTTTSSTSTTHHPQFSTHLFLRLSLSISHSISFTISASFSTIPYCPHPL